MSPAIWASPRVANGESVSAQGPKWIHGEDPKGTLIKETELAADNVIVAKDVNFAYGSGPTVLNNINLIVPEGGAVGIVGESGSGKTTLASLLIGMLTPTTGTVTVR